MQIVKLLYKVICWLCFRPDVQLIDEDMERAPTGELELEDVQIVNPKLEEILTNEQWVDDVT